MTLKTVDKSVGKKVEDLSVTAIQETDEVETDGLPPNSSFSKADRDWIEMAIENFTPAVIDNTEFNV